jgi:hypothetical protein
LYEELYFPIVFQVATVRLEAVLAGAAAEVG